MAEDNMKLLFVADYLPLRSPSVFRIQDFVGFLESFGATISVVSRMTMSDIPTVRAIESVGNTRIYRALCLDLRLEEVIVDLFQTLTTFLLCSIAVVQRNVDTIIISVPPGVPGIGAFFAGKLLHRKLVFDVRDKWEDHSIYYSRSRLVSFTHRILKKAYDGFYRKADMVTTVTPSLVKYLKARGIAKVKLIPNGADVRLFYPRKNSEKLQKRSELGLQKEDTVLVYAGAIGGYYRTDVVVQALYNLVGKDAALKIKFVIMGKGEPAKIAELLKQIKSLGLQNTVLFLGEQNREEVAGILSCCDIGVVPYDDNPLWDSAYSTKFFEYCASGLPIIATVRKISDLAALIREYNIGYVVDPLNVSQLASALNDFNSLSKIEKRRMGERARNLVERLFDRFITSKQLGEELQRISDEHKSIHAAPIWAS